MISFIVGLAAGAFHVVSGPDHLAAVAPLSITGKGRPWVVGLRWGLGHAAGVLLVGAGALTLRSALDLDTLARWGEKPVGIVLILLGLWGLHRSRARWVHVHAHSHEPGGPVHVHIHTHRAGTALEHAASSHHRDAAPEHAAHSHHHGHAAFWIGGLHGIAGSAHLLGVLPAIAFPSRTAALLYLIGFGAGTIGAMAGFAHGIGMAAARLAAPLRDRERAYRRLLAATSAIALAVGATWLLVA